MRASDNTLPRVPRMGQGRPTYGTGVSHAWDTAKLRIIGSAA